MELISIAIGIGAMIVGALMCELPAHKSGRPLVAFGIVVVAVGAVFVASYSGLSAWLVDDIDAVQFIQDGTMTVAP